MNPLLEKVHQPYDYSACDYNINPCTYTTRLLAVMVIPLTFAKLVEK